ncbi:MULTISPECIES: hypothetical protein [Hyphomicrobiales]|nr:MULTISPECIES: hypothetical protein [Hyphomicrobiales]ERI14366.1 hypothetical protein O206_22070 [Ochrobactrum sp. EGD-AQ16]MBC8719989.1 hypothetical protein [Ochrobactrum sp. Marseille-Q0166]MBP1848124.1 hypothetical protein [Neorhizobium petrolearium]MCB4919555.1 hypothetical protein [Brucella intermedia]
MKKLFDPLADKLTPLGALIAHFTGILITSTFVLLLSFMLARLLVALMK